MAEIIAEQLPRALSDTASACPFLQLPRELVYHILSYLATPWAITLALTCKVLKGLVENLGIRLKRKDVSARSELLAALQKDLPGTYFCFCCCKLRRLEPGADWDGQPHRWTPGPYRPRSWWLDERCILWHVAAPFHYHTWKSHFYIDYMEFYLVMNHHFLGPSHGIPLRSLERYASFQDEIELSVCQPSCGHGAIPGDHSRKKEALHGLCYRKSDELPRLPGLWRFSHETVPRIVNDKLYLARFYKIVGPLVPWQCLARLIGSVEPEVCRHLRCSAGSTPRYCNLVAVARNANDPPQVVLGNGLYMTPLLMSPESNCCLSCNTDYDISLRQDNVNNEWVFSLNAYHCLGSGRNPKEEIWSWFVNETPGQVGDTQTRQQERLRRLNKVAPHIGTARQNWARGAQSEVVQHSGEPYEAALCF